MRLTTRTYQGKLNRYSDWRKQVVALADERQLSNDVRDQVTEPMMKDAWWKHEYPEKFLDKMEELFAPD